MMMTTGMEEEDGLVWEHLNNFMASTIHTRTIQTTREPDSANGGQDNSKDFPKDTKVEEMKYVDEHHF